MKDAIGYKQSRPWGRLFDRQLCRLLLVGDFFECRDIAVWDVDVGILAFVQLVADLAVLDTFDVELLHVFLFDIHGGESKGNNDFHEILLPQNPRCSWRSAEN